MAYQIQREHPVTRKIQYYKWTNEGRPIYAGKSQAAQLDERAARSACAHLQQLYPDEKIEVVGA
jgi:hypothetical protein